SRRKSAAPPSLPRSTSTRSESSSSTRSKSLRAIRIVARARLDASSAAAIGTLPTSISPWRSSKWRKRSGTSATEGLQVFGDEGLNHDRGGLGGAIRLLGVQPVLGGGELPQRLSLHRAR